MLGKEQKARWEDHVAENDEIIHLSQLIRQSVEREIGGNHGHAEPHVNPERDIKFDGLQNSIDGLSGLLEDIEARLTSIERRVRDDPDLRELMNSVFEVLPTKDALADYDALVANAGAQPPDYVEPIANSGRPADIGAAIDASETRVERALRELQRNTHQVHSVEHDGETRFYKEG